MDFESAVATVRRHGLRMVLNKRDNVRFVAVGSKEAGPVSDVNDFCVTAYVEKKLTAQQLKARGMPDFRESYGAEVGGRRPRKSDTDVVESPGTFRARAGSNPLRAQRGRPCGRD